MSFGQSKLIIWSEESNSEESNSDKSNSDKSENHGSEGLLTSIWGPPTWESLHCITFGYPRHPTKKDKKYYLMFFKLLTKTLPCCVCRDHYTEYVFSNKEKHAFNSQDFL